MAEEVKDDEWGVIDPRKSKEEENKVEFEIEGEEPAAQKVETNNNQEEDTDDQQQDDDDNNDTDTNEDKKEPKELEGIETQGAQKRIRQLIRQRKEREDEIGALQKRIQDYEKRLKEKEEQEYQNTEVTLQSSEQQLQEQAQLAEAALKQALEAGESDDIVKAQKQLYSAQVKLERLEDAKKQHTQRKPKVPQEEQPTATTQQREAEFDIKAAQWVANNEWFNKDFVMTAAALAIDAELKQEGFSPSDDEFYEEIDSRLRKEFPHKFKGAKKAEEPAPVKEEEVIPEPKVPQKPSQVVGSTSRSVTNPSTGRANKVKLTQADVAHAERWGIPLERYAQQKLAAEQAGEGEYTTIVTGPRGGN